MSVAEAGLDRCMAKNVASQTGGYGRGFERLSGTFTVEVGAERRGFLFVYTVTSNVSCMHAAIAMRRMGGVFVEEKCMLVVHVRCSGRLGQIVKRTCAHTWRGRGSWGES